VFDNFGEVVNILKDINALTPEMHTDDGFQTLIDAVSQRFTEDQTAQADSGHHSTTISNQTNVSGNGHIVVQGVSGTTINISTNTQPVNQNPPTSQPSSDSQQTSDLDPPGRNYKIANIVKLINSAYNDEELQNFCMINFDAVFSNFAATQNRTQKIMSLVDYCKRKLQFEQLLGFIRDENEAQYERNKPYY